MSFSRRTQPAVESSDNPDAKGIMVLGSRLGRPVSAAWFDSNAVEMTTAEHYMYLMRFCGLLACQFYCTAIYLMVASCSVFCCLRVDT